MWKLVCLFLFQAFASASGLWAQEKGASLELPRLALDNFSPDIRIQIQEAYSFATIHPKDPAESGRLGMILQDYELIHEAAIVFRHAAELAPEGFRWIYYLGIVEADRGDCEHASLSLRGALRIRSDYLPAKLRLADCRLASADWEPSRKLYSEVLKQDGANPAAYYGLGKINAHLGDLAAAIDDYRKAIASF